MRSFAAFGIHEGIYAERQQVANREIRNLKGDGQRAREIQCLRPNLPRLMRGFRRAGLSNTCHISTLYKEVGEINFLHFEFGGAFLQRPEKLFFKFLLAFGRQQCVRVPS